MPAATSVETYLPSPKQNEFHADGSKVRLLLGAFGAGKSAAMIWDIIMVALEHPGARIVIFRKTYPALRDTTWRDFLTECPNEIIVPGSERKSEGREEVTITGGSVVLARCLDDWRKLGSAAYDFECLDEAIEVHENEFDMLLKGRLRGKIGPRKMILATNPPNREHWLYRRFEKQPEGDMAVHHFRTYDNYVLCPKEHPNECDRNIALDMPDHTAIPDGLVCHHNLPDGYIAGLESRPENFKKRFLYGDWGFTARGTPVFPEFMESRHVAPLRVERGVAVIRGWDFGYHHPACVWVQVLPTGHIHVLHELLGVDEDLEIFARRVQQATVTKFPDCPVTDYCDIAGSQKNDLGTTAIRILRSSIGISPRFRKLGIWKTVEGIRGLIARTHLGVPLLRVDTSCIWVREALEGGYVLRIKPDGSEEPNKDGTYDHCMDALRYALADTLTFSATDARRVVPFTRPRIAV